ncbi:MAG: hypothetical protein HON30_00890 [Nitrosopumilus sp.]|jgi:uncharacterized protein YhhL (DUF1145 family)|nr:hypothetical protein [Nitrosopumilus sp.]
MSNISSKTIASFKYVYLIIFFAFLSGIFYPLINELSFDIVINGIVVLFIGLIGGIILFKSTTSETKKELFFGIGFSLIGFSLYLIYYTADLI